MNRYRNLFDALDELRRDKTHLRLLECGVGDGVRACHLLGRWKHLGGGRSAHFIGVDHFERSTINEVSRRISGALPKVGCHILKYVEGVFDTLAPDHKVFDLIVLGGDPSPDVCLEYWRAVAPLLRPETIVMLDNYCDERVDFGCRHLAETLEAEPRDPGRATQFRPKYSVYRLEPVDVVSGIAIRLARVQLAKI